jgi:hypothetical protein
MKNTVISLALFLVLFTSLIFINNKFTELCSNLIEQSNQIEELLDKQEYSLAYLKALDLLDYINSNDFIPSIYLNHVDYDNLINECIKLCIYIKKEDASEACASLDLIEFSCEHLIKIQKINLKNIL